MTVKSVNARQRILNAAMKSILSKGFSATSIEDIIKSAHITKSGFFYHFKGKNELAVALVEMYLDEDEQFFNKLFDRANKLSEDPLQQMLIFLKLLSEAMADMENGHPGCLAASIIYQSAQFEEKILHLVKQGMHDWQKLFREKINLIENKYKSKIDIASVELAENLISIIEGAIITSLVLQSPKVLPQQLLHFRNYLRLLFDNNLK